MSVVQFIIYKNWIFWFCILAELFIVISEICFNYFHLLSNLRQKFAYIFENLIYRLYAPKKLFPRKLLMFKPVLETLHNCNLRFSEEFNALQPALSSVCVFCCNHEKINCLACHGRVQYTTVHNFC